MDRLERIYRYEQSCEFLPHRLKSLALSLPDKQKERVEELRLRVMHPLTVLTLEGELNAAPDGRASLVTVEDLEQMLGAVTEYSRYACIETLRQGFLPLRGGFRLGVCGSAVVRDGEVSNLKDISSLALRIVCEHIGLGSDIAPQLFSADGRFLSTLILSPPGGGKTTLLRDLIRVLSLGDAEQKPWCARGCRAPRAARGGQRRALRARRVLQGASADGARQPHGRALALPKGRRHPDGAARHEPAGHRGR